MWIQYKYNIVTLEKSEQKRGIKKMDKKDKREWSMWHIRVPERLDSRLDDYIKEDSFASKAEFVREAVRDRLEVEREKLKGEVLNDK